MAQFKFNPITGALDLVEAGTPGATGPQGPAGPPGADGADGEDAADWLPLGGPYFPARRLTQGGTEITITNQDGAGGNPTFTLQTSLINHALLGGLVTGDAGHTQFLLLAGRAGTTNDPVISSSGITGTVYGTVVASGFLALRGSTSGVVTESEAVDVLSRLRVRPQLTTQIGSTEFAFVSAGDGTAYTIVDAGRMEAYDYQTTLNCVGNLVAMRVVQNRSLITNDAGLTSDIGTWRAFNNIPTLTPGTGSSMVNLLHVALNAGEIYSNTGTGNTITERLAVRSGGTLGASWTAADWALGRLVTPGGGGTITRLGFGIIDDPAAFAGTIGAAFTLWSKGAGPFLAHGGPAIFGASQSTLTAPAASTVVELSGTTTALLLTRATAAGVATPANGHLFYDTGTTKLTARENGAWVTFQPFDADLTTLAGLTVAQGALILGSAAPAWSVLGIGATDKYLRSNGTTAAWSAVTELGLVDTYNGITTVSVGLPSIVAEVNSTGLTANVGLTGLYTPPADGYYRISGFVALTTPATTSSTLPNINIAWTNGDSAATQSLALSNNNPGYGGAETPVITNLTTTAWRGGAAVIWANGGNAIFYSTGGYMSVGATAMAYSLRLRVEAL